jgi:hypothetical protein
LRQNNLNRNVTRVLKSIRVPSLSKKAHLTSLPPLCSRKCAGLSFGLIKVRALRKQVIITSDFERNYLLRQR